jgi:hypothetical protein
MTGTRIGALRYEAYTGQWQTYNGSTWEIISPIIDVNYTPDWKKWWAWRPVRVHGKWTWFKIIYRKKINTYDDDWVKYEYGTIFDVLRQT